MTRFSECTDRSLEKFARKVLDAADNTDNRGDID